MSVTIRREVRCGMGKCRRLLGWVTVRGTSGGGSAEFEVPDSGRMVTNRGPGREGWYQTWLHCRRHGWVDMGEAPVIAAGLVQAQEAGQLPDVLLARKSFTAPLEERFPEVESPRLDRPDDWEGAVDELRFEGWEKWSPETWGGSFGSRPEDGGGAE